MLLSVSNISKSLGGHHILNGVSFQMNMGQHTGLVGANGVGKSTLLKIITNTLEADRGEITIQTGVDVGYLPQVLSHVSEKSIAEVIDESQGDLQVLRDRLAKLEEALSQPADNDLSSVMDEYGELVERFERLGGYDAEHRVESVLSGLKLDYIDTNRRISSLSGGEKARVAIAALLISSPELLLLDEPTNHLDLSSLEWLETYLTSHRGGLLLVSHDRELLNRTVNSIVEIEEHSRASVTYAGNYDSFVQLKNAARAKWEIAFELQQEEMKELKRIIRGRARHVGHNRPAPDRDKITHKFFGERVQRTVSRNIRAAEEKLQQLEATLITKPPEKMRINSDLRPERLQGRAPLTAANLIKSFGEIDILNDVSFMLREDSRIVLTGPNGAGKTTLLRVLAGLDRVENGDVFIAPTVKIGYLDQEQETLDLSKSLVDAYAQNLSGDREEIKVRLLRTGFFTYSEFQKPVAALSVGQKRKLQIAKLVAERGNLLLLDEPTNHISFDVLEEFENALLSFRGPVLAVSHDRRFIRLFAKEIWVLNQGKIETKKSS
jgi:macrolide transport system ATP-binding/permease protein